uniref:Putative ovule protein n=1 Tax=Solanum chacoense TaxID=4108 RepID=A0A0V0H3F2_SOLCH
MLAMGLTLELKDLLNLFLQKPLSILFGCAAQYTIMPAFGVIVSKYLALSPSVSVGLILLACCPGGTASNVAHMFLWMRLGFPSARYKWWLLRFS